MNGHFEVDQTAYPIGYLKSGDGYRVTDMRTLKALHSHPIPVESAKAVAADVNTQIRAGATYIQNGQELYLIGAVAIALEQKEYPI